MRIRPIWRPGPSDAGQVSESEFSGEAGAETNPGPATRAGGPLEGSGRAVCAEVNGSAFGGIPGPGPGPGS